MNCRTSMLADFKFALLSLYLLISWMNYFDKLRQRPVVNVAKYTTKIKFKQIHKCILTWVALVQVSPPMHPYAGHQSAISLCFASSWAGHILANRRQWRGLSSNRHRFLNCSMACTSWSIIRVIRHSAIGHDWTEVLWSLLCYSCLSLKSHSNLQIFAVIFPKRLLRGC